MGVSVRVAVVGASAGGVEAIERLVAGLPANLGACVLVTLHTSPTARSGLPRILSRAGRLPAEHGRDGRPLTPNTIVVAPPDRHLVVADGRVRLDAGPTVNRHRPSVDVMLTSAAHWAGPSVVAAILSGALDDGAVGAALVAEAGGVVVVQDPGEAQFSGMPKAALAAAPTAIAASVTELAGLVTAAVQARRVARPRADLAQGDPPMSMADRGDPQYLSPEETRLTRLVCPDCDGSLAQVDLRKISYYRCHVGHQWSPETLAAAQTEAVENKLWSALAALEEQAALRRYLATHGGNVTETAAAEHLRAAREATDRGETLRTVLDQPTPHAPHSHGNGDGEEHSP